MHRGQLPMVLPLLVLVQPVGKQIARVVQPRRGVCCAGHHIQNTTRALVAPPIALRLTHALTSNLSDDLPRGRRGCPVKGGTS